MPGFTPKIVTSLRAIRRCRPHFSIEVARQITPSRSKWKSLKYIVATWVWREANSDDALSTVVASNNVANLHNIKSDIGEIFFFKSWILKDVYLWGLHNAKERKDKCRKEGRHWQRQCLCHPEYCHQHQYKCTLSHLKDNTRIAVNHPL